MGQYNIKTSFMFEPKEDEDTAKYGHTWYCTVEEMAFPVIFNLPKGEEVMSEDRVTFEEEEVKAFKSGKNQGNEYRRIKKVKVQSGAPVKKVKEEDIVLEDIPDEPADLSSIPF